MTETDTEKAGQAAPKRRQWKLFVVTLLVLGALFWFLHPPALAWAIRKGLPLALEPAGFNVSLGTIESRLDRPIVITDIRLTPNNAPKSRTLFRIGKLQASLNSLGRIFFGNGRIFREAAASDARILIDSRAEAMPAIPMPELTDAEEKSQAEMLLRLLPERITLDVPRIEIEGDRQSYTFTKFKAVFSEADLGEMTAESSTIDAGGIHEQFGPITAITAWKNGTAYLADSVLRDNIRIENFSAALARPGGVALDFAAQAFDGSVRGGVAFGNSKGLVTIDAAAWMSGIDLSALGTFISSDEKITGIIGETRITFRGSPDKLAEAEASLRMEASKVLWKNRGWESLEIGANLIHQRLVINEFQLHQKENSLSANGEISIKEGWASLAKVPFLMNVSGSIQDLGALAGLVGSPFDEMTGRMTLSGSVNGAKGRLEGYLNVEASDVGYRERPVESAKIDILFSGEEARIARCEVWSGDDYILAKGNLGIHSPYRYSGELQARIQDLTAYATLFRAPGAETMYAGSLQARWQGDGTLSAHSGAFNIALDDFLSDQTPSGLTGRFAGTYSPENLYFSGIELAHDQLVFSTRATVARNGVTLKDAVLKNRKRELADAEVYLPLDVFSLAGGKTIAESLNLEKPAYVTVSSRGDLALDDLFELAGQEAPATGTLRLNLLARGPVTSPMLEGELAGRNIVVKTAEGNSLPPSTLDLDLSSADGRARVNGQLATRGFSPLNVAFASPFGFTRAEDGKLSWTNPNGSVEGNVTFPKTDLALFRPLLPDFRGLGGTLSGDLKIGGTFANPQINGQIGLANGWLQTTTRAPRISDVNVSLNFNATQMNIARLDGQIAAGPFSATGLVNFANPSNLRYDIGLKGDKVLLARDPSVRLRSNLNIHASGDNAGGEISGEVKLVDGRLYKRLEITPLLAPSPEDEAAFLPPDLSGKVPMPFATWKLNVSITNETPFLLKGNIATGTIDPALRVTGTLDQPVPEGQIELQNARAYLPFTTMFIERGWISFDAATPWMPILDVRGNAEVLDYDVQLYAYGALSERNLILRSDPPLSQEQLVLLLTTGFAPGLYSGAGFGEAAIGQGSLLLLRTFVRQFEGSGVDLDSFINRLQITAQPPRNQFEQSTLRGRFRLWEGLSLMSERDGYGFYNAGATYTLRFR